MAKQKILRTVSELNARYARFCQTHELEASISAHEQIAETEKQQLWLDAHVEALELAIAAEKGAAQLKSNVTLEDSKAGAKGRCYPICYWQQRRGNQRHDAQRRATYRVT